MSLNTELDLVIVGGGIAGLVAANRACELGLNVLILEAEIEEKYKCATRLSGGVFHTIFNSVRTPPETLYERLVFGTSALIHSKLAWALANNSARVVDWMIAGGAKFSTIEPNKSGWVDAVASPLGYQNQTKLLWEGFGADTLMHHLENRLVARGGVIKRGHRAIRLLRAGDSCIGVVAFNTPKQKEQQYSAHATLLADGSYHGNIGLVRRYLKINPDNVAYRGPILGKGDGLLMAQELDAEILETEWFYGHLLSKSALSNEALQLFPFLDFLASAGILVDGLGQRYLDEGKGGCYMANVTAKKRSGQGTVIFDEAIWNEEGKQSFSPPNPFLIRNGGTLHKSNDLSTLADLAGLPRHSFLETVKTYNEAVISGALQNLLIARTNSEFKAKPIINPPYYAAPTCSAISQAFGRLKIDEQARVLHKNGSFIKGLYAAGAICGGIDGGPEANYVGGLIIGAVFGLLAAENVVEIRTL